MTATACFLTMLILPLTAAATASSGSSDYSVFVVERPIPGECTQVNVEEIRAVAAANLRSNASGCNFWEIAGCGAAAAAAGLTCGGPLEPADYACIMAAVSVIPGCGPCLCKSVGCPSWCPCDGNSLQSANHSGTFHAGTCAEEGYDIVVGKRMFNITFPVKGESVMTTFKRKPDLVV